MTQKAAGQTTRAAKAPTPVPQLMLQRACACGQHTPGGECAECRKKAEGTLQRSAAGSSAVPAMPSAVPAMPSIVHDVLRSPGQSLDAATRAYMEPRFGHDFSHVRIHTDDRAARSARAVDALAYTVGRNVVLGAGQYAPGTEQGKRLLAHELTHTLQQGDAPAPGASLTIDDPGSLYERHANAAAERVAAGESADAFHHAESVHTSGLMRKPKTTCASTFSKAGSAAALIVLVRAAETKMSAAGITAVEDQIKTLRGVYYGTTWSLDFKVEKSAIRNKGFNWFTQSLTNSPQDPTTIFDCGLFDALQKSQDVKFGSVELDFGHTIVALDARNATTPLLPGANHSFPGFGGTGTEIVTWLGDLGGGAGSLAVDRGRAVARKASPPSVSTKFHGTDYGASSNLEGDVAGFVVARGTATSPVPPVIPKGKGIADTLQDYLTPGKPGAEWKGRATTFLMMNGAFFNLTGSLANRTVLIAGFASQIETFACQYLASRAADGKIAPADLTTATDHVKPAAQEVAETFVDALDDSHKTGAKIEAKRFPAPTGAALGACRAVSLGVSAGKGVSKVLDAVEKFDKGIINDLSKRFSE